MLIYVQPKLKMILNVNYENIFLNLMLKKLLYLLNLKRNFMVDKNLFLKQHVNVLMILMKNHVVRNQVLKMLKVKAVLKSKKSPKKLIFEKKMLHVVFNQLQKQLLKPRLMRMMMTTMMTMMMIKLMIKIVMIKIVMTKIVMTKIVMMKIVMIKLMIKIVK